MIRSIKELRGYDIAAQDGEIGDIHDLFFDDHAWTVRCLVIDTRNWLPGKKVLVAPVWTNGIDWGDRKLLGDATRDSIKQAPEYEAGMQIDEPLERRVFQHYGKTPYWE